MSYELYYEDGDDFRSVTVSLSADKITVYTQDMGRAAEEFWGADDYEFWIAVQKAEFGELLVALIRELFDGDPKATDGLKEICVKHNIKHEWMNWI